MTPLFVPHTRNTHFPSTSELIQRHWRERYRCANTEIMTIRIWNDGNSIRIVETTTNDHSSKSPEIRIKTRCKSLTSHSHSNLKQIPIRQIHSVKHRNTTILFFSIPIIHKMQWNPNLSLHPHNPNQSSKRSYTRISISPQLKTQSALHSTHNNLNSKNSSPITISTPI